MRTGKARLPFNIIQFVLMLYYMQKDDRERAPKHCKIGAICASALRLINTTLARLQIYLQTKE